MLRAWLKERVLPWVDLGFRGVDRDNSQVEIIHRGKYKSLTRPRRRWLRRRQAVEPAIGHLKSDHRMDRCWLQGQLGDALHAVLCAAGYNFALVAAGYAPLGPEDCFFAPRFMGVDDIAQWRSVAIRFGQ